jgi:5-methylcytosine-specific restriction enzyme subunit McrC
MPAMSQNKLTVFEHERRTFGPDDEVYKALKNFFGEKGVPYYSLINKGVKFSSYVGVIQVGKTLIEVLPKTDKNETNKTKWRKVLVNMLKQVGVFKVHAPSHASLNLKSNSILELYFELFLNEVEELLHKGLIKKYRRVAENQKALNGALKFNKHISENIIHKERFYVSHSNYDKHHALHQIIYKTIKLIQSFNTNNFLSSKIGNLMLNFPEMDDIVVNENLFKRITYNRKSEPYRYTIEISRLLLLNYHPDLSKGRNNVLALMFDMNVLFERYVAKMIKRAAKDDIKVKTQTIKHFWYSESMIKRLKPDIIVQKAEKTWVLDTKWKLPANNKPSDEDLRQMYAYGLQFGAEACFLLYPQHSNSKSYPGRFKEPDGDRHLNLECSMYSVDVVDEGGLNKKIGEEIIELLK